MKLGEIIKEYRIANNLTMHEFSTRSGLSKGYISILEKNKRPQNNKEIIPSIDTFNKVAVAMNISLDALLKMVNSDQLISLEKDHLEPSNVTPVDLDQSSKISGVSIPIVGTIVAGMPVDAYEDILGYEEISPELARTGEFVCLRVKGNSMSPKIEAGDLVIVRLQSDVDSGDVAVVKINGDETTLKKVQKSEAGITLIAYNPAVYEPHFYNNEEIENLLVLVCGKVVEMKRTF